MEMKNVRWERANYRGKESLGRNKIFKYKFYLKMNKKYIHNIIINGINDDTIHWYALRRNNKLKCNHINYIMNIKRCLFFKI